jgi:hypothetical protein
MLKYASFIGLLNQNKNKYVGYPASSFRGISRKCSRNQYLPYKCP